MQKVKKISSIIKTKGSKKEHSIEKQFDEVSSMILSARAAAYSKVNSVLVELYWNLGMYISRKVDTSEWGDSTIDKLAEYISAKIPDVRGFNRRSLYRMKQFYDTYSENEFVSPLVTQIQWTNHLIILSRARTIEEKIFYLQECVKGKPSKRELEHMISSCLFERTVTTVPKITRTLKNVYPAAETIFRDSYTLDFLGLPSRYNESDL